MSGNTVADIIAGALLGLALLWLVVKARRARRSAEPTAPTSSVHRPFQPSAPRREVRPVYRGRPITDRRSLWALRYSAGGAATAASWSAGSGLSLPKKDGVGDPVAGCSGSPGLAGGAACGGGCAGGCGGGGVGCSAGGCGGGGGGCGGS